MKPTVNAPASFFASGAGVGAEPAGAASGVDLLQDKAERDSAPDSKRRDRREANIVMASNGIGSRVFPNSFRNTSKQTWSRETPHSISIPYFLAQNRRSDDVTARQHGCRNRKR